MSFATRDNQSKAPKVRKPYSQCPFYVKIFRDIVRSPALYIMLIPVLVYYFLFRYRPMYGVLIAFTDYMPGSGKIVDFSQWVGLEHFIDFFTGKDAWRVIRNTLQISLTTILFGFPAPIIFALLLNELRLPRYSKVVQTVSYLPHFISLVVICGMIRTFVGGNGFISVILSNLGFIEPGVSLMGKMSAFLPVYVASDVWQTVGYNSIVFLAAIAGVNQELYEAATVDGASRWKRVWHVTLPSIMPTIITMLLLRLGNVMTVGYEKIILLYSPQIYEVSDVISSYVYRAGLQQARYSYSTAVGLFNSVINFVILLLANRISRKVSDTALW
ncbi:MAG: ABC transporter permease [Oscillospiraceae bacterium]